MCGITGIVSATGILPGQTQALRAMNSALIHRGPDGMGEYCDTHVAMAMRRLSIIDLESGWQPLYNEDQSLVLIANGEIYNFVELRVGLGTKGHCFRTGSDCECIVHLYEEYGINCVDYLRGMFAFALWDTSRKRLVLARDRMGEKPLYLYQRDGLLIFSSELKSLLRCGFIPFELDPEAVNLYFHYQYVPEPRTPIKDVRKLDAAHLLVIDVEPWRVDEFRYWDMEDAPPLGCDPGVAIRTQLDELSEIIIRADVPVGVALSGGLDSSVVAILAAQKYPGTMHAFSIGYAGRPPNDERAEAKDLANYLKMPFHDIELTTSEMVGSFPEVVFWRDDPIADIAGHGYYMVMKLAREHGVPVVLQGQGGDELFWGYPWVRQAVEESIQKTKLLELGKWKALPRVIRLERPPGLGLKQLGHWLIRRKAGLSASWERLLRLTSGPGSRMVFYELSPDFAIAQKRAKKFYTERFRMSVNDRLADDLYNFPHPWPKVDVRITRLICDLYLRENGITQGDRLGMACSVELRLPLVDHKLVETVIGLRRTQNDYLLSPKTWLKSALCDVIPEWVMNRPKRGFQPPVREWHDALFDRYGKLLEEGYLVEAGVLSPEAARRLAKGDFEPGAITPISFKALVLELWCRQISMGEVLRMS